MVCSSPVSDRSDITGSAEQLRKESTVVLAVFGSQMGVAMLAHVCLARVYGANTGAVDRRPVRARSWQTADFGRRCNLSVLGHDVVGFLFLHSATTRSKGCVGVFNDDSGARQHDLHDNPAVLDVLRGLQRAQRSFRRAGVSETNQRFSRSHKEAFGQNGDAGNRKK